MGWVDFRALIRSANSVAGTQVDAPFFKRALDGKASGRVYLIGTDSVSVSQSVKHMVADLDEESLTDRLVSTLATFDLRLNELKDEQRSG